MVGDGLNGDAATFGPLSAFAPAFGFNGGGFERADAKLGEVLALRIHGIEDFAQEVNEKFFQIFAARRQRAALGRMNFLRLQSECNHATRGVREQFCKRLSERLQADVCRVLEDFVGRVLHGTHSEA